MPDNRNLGQPPVEKHERLPDEDWPFPRPYCGPETYFELEDEKREPRKKK